MTPRNRAELTRLLIAGPMPPDCLRVQIWRMPGGGIDGGCTMDVDRMGLADGMAYLVSLRRVTADVEQNLLEHLAERHGDEIEALRAIVDEMAAQRPRQDSVMEARSLDGGSRP